MDEEIHKLVGEVLKNCRCPNCGGHVYPAKCNYCKSELSKEKDEIRKESIDKLTSFIKENSSAFSNCNSLCAELFPLSTHGIAEVDGVLEENNYKEFVEEILDIVATENHLLSENSNYIKLCNSGVDVYSAMMKIITQNIGKIFGELNHKGVSFDKIKNNCSFLVFKAIVDKKYSTYPEQMQALYKQMIYAVTSFYGINTTVAFKNMDKNVLGSSCRNFINVANDIFDNSPEIILDTLIHEEIHRVQEEMLMQGFLSNHFLTMAKDGILMDILGKQFTNENYNSDFTLFPHEQEAYLHSPKITLDVLRTLKCNPSDEFYSYMDRITQWTKEGLDVGVRFFNGDAVELDTLFEREVAFYPKSIERYPQISFEYKVENETIIRKNSLELKEDYEKYKSGEIVWKGDENEICALYEQTIKKQETIEEASKKDSL